MVVLERFPVPVLAIAEDGAILFANKAFAEMLTSCSQSATGAGECRIDSRARNSSK
jgi:nitrogen-specific signal transduction histidine kinase